MKSQIPAHPLTWVTATGEQIIHINALQDLIVSMRVTNLSQVNRLPADANLKEILGAASKFLQTKDTI